MFETSAQSGRNIIQHINNKDAWPHPSFLINMVQYELTKVIGLDDDMQYVFMNFLLESKSDTHSWDELVQVLLGNVQSLLDKFTADNAVFPSNSVALAKSADFYSWVDELCESLNDATDSYDVIDVCFAALGELTLHSGFNEACPIVESVGCIEVQRVLVDLVHTIHNVLYCDDDIFEFTKRAHVGNAINTLRHQYNLELFEKSFDK